MKAGIWDLHAVCMSETVRTMQPGVYSMPPGPISHPPVCVCIVVRQRLVKNFTAATNTHSTKGEVLDVILYAVGAVSKELGAKLLPEIFVTISHTSLPLTLSYCEYQCGINMRSLRLKRDFLALIVRRTELLT